MLTDICFHSLFSGCDYSGKEFLWNVIPTLTLSCWTWIYPAFANSVDPDQLASSEANWSGSALFDIKYVNLYQQSGSSNLIEWKLEVGAAS